MIIEPEELLEEKSQIFRFIPLNEKSFFSLEDFKDSCYAISNTLQIGALISKKNNNGELKIVKLSEVYDKIKDLTFKSFPLNLELSELNNNNEWTLQFNYDEDTLILYANEDNSEESVTTTRKKTKDSKNKNVPTDKDCNKRHKLFIASNWELLVVDYSDITVIKKLECVKGPAVVSSLNGNDKNQLLVGTLFGEICLIDFKDDKIISNVKFNKGNRFLSSLYWFDKNYAVGHDILSSFGINEPKSMGPRLLLFKLDDNGVLKHISISSCFLQDSCNNSKKKLFYKYLKEWGTLICGYDGNSRLVLFSNKYSDKSWKHLNLTYPVELSSSLNKQENANYPLGIDVDLRFNEKILKRPTSLRSYPASPLIHIWTNSGKLRLYSLINTIKPKPYPGISSSATTNLEITLSHTSTIIENNTTIITTGSTSTSGFNFGTISPSNSTTDGGFNFGPLKTVNNAPTTGFSFDAKSITITETILNPACGFGGDKTAPIESKTYVDNNIDTSNSTTKDNDNNKEETLSDTFVENNIDKKIESTSSTKESTNEKTELLFENEYFDNLALKIIELSEELNVKIDKINLKQTYYELKIENNNNLYNELISHIEKYLKLIQLFEKLNNKLTESTNTLETMNKILESNSNKNLEILRNEIKKQKKKHFKILMKMKRLEIKLFSVKLNTFTNYKKQLELYI